MLHRVLVAVTLLTLGSLGCSVSVSAGLIELEAGAAGQAPDLAEAGAHSVLEAGAGGALGTAAAGAPAEVQEGGAGGVVDLGGAGSPAGGDTSVAGSSAGAAAAQGGAAPSEGGAGSAAGAPAGGSVDIAGDSAGGSAGSTEVGSNAGGASEGGAPAGTECPYHVSSEGISAQYGHTITATFPVTTFIAAADLTALAGYTVTPSADGVQNAKAFAGGSVWSIPPINRMKTISFVITPFTSAPLMPAGGLVLFCK